MNETVECPYCREENTVTNNEYEYLYSLDEAQEHEKQCEHCSKTFYFKASINYSFDALKPE